MELEKQGIACYTASRFRQKKIQQRHCLGSSSNRLNLVVVCTTGSSGRLKFRSYHKLPIITQNWLID